MTLDTLFTVTCAIAAVGWIVILFVSPFWFAWDKFVVSIIIILPAITYTFLNFTNPDPDILSKFSTLPGFQSLLQNKGLLLAAWEHFLAFDLLAAFWIKKNSVKLGISHGLIIIPLIFTCALGPLGFLLYLLVRWFKTKNYFTSNDA